MAVIIEFPCRNESRYARKFGDTCDEVGELVLFTGVQYERADDNREKSGHGNLPEGELSDGFDVPGIVGPKSAG